MASWIDALAFRSGPLLDAATHFAATRGVECDPPAGSAGLSWLAQNLERFVDAADAADDQDERAFVEGAGAYFALILLKHFTGATHRAHGGTHRLKLGSHGYVDPFASIERALHASDVRRALLQEVALAEAEARGEGPLSRVVREAKRQLAEQTEAQVADHYDRTLWVDLHGSRIELDLARLLEVTRGESDATLAAAVRRLVAALRAEPESSAAPFESVRERLYPRLVGPAFMAKLASQRESLHLLRLTREVWVTLVLHYGERARYVRRAEFDTWSKDGALPRAQALQNLARTSVRARFLQHETARGNLVIAESRDGHDAARLLLPGLCELLASALGSPVVVGVPHRDALLAAKADDEAAIALLRERVDEAFLRAPHAITRSLLVLSEDGIRELEAAAEPLHAVG